MRKINLFLLLAAVFLGSQALADEDWKFDAGIYGWLPNIDMELPDGQKTKITQNDILENLDMAFMAGFKASRGKWSVGTDFIYMNLAHKGRESLDEGLDLRKVDLQEYLITPSIGYRVLDSSDGFMDIFGGVRYLWLQPKLTFQLVDPLPPGSFNESDSEDRWDGIVGVRGVQKLDQHWFVRYSADVGTGDSDSVYNLFAGVGYEFQSFSLVAAWRYLKYDFGDDWVLKELAVNGPLVGAVFNF